MQPKVAWGPTQNNMATQRPYKAIKGTLESRTAPVTYLEGIHCISGHMPHNPHQPKLPGADDSPQLQVLKPDGLSAWCCWCGQRDGCRGTALL